MRILLTAPQPFFEERGTPIAVRMLAETLRDFGHEVDLLVYHCGADVPMPGVRVIRAARPPGVDHVPIGISWQKLACDLWLIATMLHLHSARPYDVIHAVEEAVFPAALLAVATGRKLVYDMDSSLTDQLTDKWWPLRPFRPLLVALEKMAVTRASVVLPVCEDLAARVRPWIDPERVIVIPDPPMGNPEQTVSDESLHDLARPDDVLGLYVGNLEYYQGIDLLLKALERLDGSVRFRMVVIGGRPEDIAHYNSRARDLCIESRVNFIGARPLAHLNAYLAQADVLVSPRTQGQNTPMKIYSYMQSGKAILATDIRSHTQALDDHTAKLVAAEPISMANGIACLARDPELRARLGAAARAKVDSEYSIAVYREKLERAYRLVE